ALLQCSALRRPALPGLQTREHDPERLQGPRCEMQHKRQRHFAFVLRRWLTWFYPQVCQNQALSGRQSFVLPASCRHPPQQIADVNWAATIILQSSLEVLGLDLNCSESG